VLITDSGHLS